MSLKPEFDKDIILPGSISEYKKEINLNLPFRAISQSKINIQYPLTHNDESSDSFYKMVPKSSNKKAILNGSFQNPEKIHNHRKILKKNKKTNIYWLILLIMLTILIIILIIIAFILFQFKNETIFILGRLFFDNIFIFKILMKLIGKLRHDGTTISINMLTTVITNNIFKTTSLSTTTQNSKNNFTIQDKTANTIPFTSSEATIAVSSTPISSTLNTFSFTLSQNKSQNFNNSIKVYSLEQNVTISEVIDQGYTVIYNFTYSHASTSFELNQIYKTCNTNTIICAGGSLINSNILLLLSCGNCRSILKETNINITILDNGAYWYFTRTYGFGFAPNSTILLSTCDKFDTSNKLRLCWHLDQNLGGWRLGSLVWFLNTNNNFSKYLFIY